MDTSESGVIYESEVDLYINYIDHTKIKEVEKNFSSFLLWCDESNKNTQSEEIENIEGKNKNNKTTRKYNKNWANSIKYNLLVNIKLNYIYIKFNIYKLFYINWIISFFSPHPILYFLNYLIRHYIY